MKRPNASGCGAAGRAVITLLALSLLSNCEDPVELKPAPEAPPGSPEAVVTALAKAYQQRDPELFRSVLANEHGANADYLFFLSEPTNVGETQWDYAEEARIHQRMFRPDQPAPGDPVVPSDLWLQSIQITLTPLEVFKVREDLYSANEGKDGKLDPHRWRATDARYSTYVYFDLANTDYKVEGESNFVVIEDLAKQVGQAGKFLLFVWEDLGSGFPGISQSSSSWGSVKGLYR